MEVMYRRCCGVDVHKKMIVSCFLIGDKREIRQFGTTTKELRELVNWLSEGKCEMVAMESTGAYWKPIYNVLEVFGIPTMVVNAQHMKALPGRKTDVKDSQWIAELLQHGLLKASFIPERAQRELREISRYRKSLIEERAREINRLEKTLEGGNIKLSSIVRDIMGKSSRSLLEGVLSNQLTKENIEEFLYGSLKSKKEELFSAMDGVLTLLQKKLIKAIINHVDDMTMRIQEMDAIISCEMEKSVDTIKAIDEIPGIGTRSAQVIIAEIGLDMERFPTASHLASWAGLSPGNNESAGKRKSGRTCKGNATLKTTLVQCAKSASRVSGSFFKAQYEKLVVRRGANRATVAVAHSMLIAIYNMLKKKEAFKDLGYDYYKQFNTEKKIGAYLKKLAELGWEPPISVAN